MLYRKQFTLIELLVVVAIISILASMLLPSLGKARQAAQRSTCANNEKQIVSAVFMYTDAHDDIMPHNALRAPATASVMDHLHQADILRGSTNAQDKTAFVCPEYPMGTYRSDHTVVKSTYAVNLYTFGYQSAAGFAAHLPQRRLNQFANKASDILLIGDGIYDIAPQVYIGFAQSQELGKYHAGADRYTFGVFQKYAHGGRLAGAYADGHVGYWLAPKQFNVEY